MCSMHCCAMNGGNRKVREKKPLPISYCISFCHMLSPFSSANNNKSVKIFDVRDDGVGIDIMSFRCVWRDRELKKHPKFFNALRNISLITPLNLNVRRSASIRQKLIMLLLDPILPQYPPPQSRVNYASFRPNYSTSIRLIDFDPLLLSFMFTA